MTRPNEFIQESYLTNLTNFKKLSNDGFLREYNLRLPKFALPMNKVCPCLRTVDSPGCFSGRCYMISHDLEHTLPGEGVGTAGLASMDLPDSYEVIQFVGGYEFPKGCRLHFIPWPEETNMEIAQPLPPA